MEEKNQQYSRSYLCEKIIEESYDAIVVNDRQGRYVIVNRATEESMGLKKEQILGRTPADLIRDGIYGSSTILEALRTRKTVTGLVIVRDVGRLSTSVPFFDEKGEIEFVMTNNRSDLVLGEFTRQLAYEREQHNHYRDIAHYLYTSGDSEMVCRSEQMHALRCDCAVIAIADSAVMVVGESGVGKELVARYIHAQSPRSLQAFIAVNCSAIPPELFESEFFGYRPGAFTGASSKGKPGFLRMAHGGTLFLDELGELPLAMQSKLLRFVESGEFYPIGSSRPERVDVRIVTATNRNLMQMVQDGSFRSDLYYRLHVIPVHVPPLRERPQDIEAIAAYYIDRYNKKYSRPTVLTEESLHLLCQYAWPGNVRELRNVIERAVLMARPGNASLPLRGMLGAEWETSGAGGENGAKGSKTAGTEVRGGMAGAAAEDGREAAAAGLSSVPAGLPLAEAAALFERRYIEAAVAASGGALGEAAQALGIHRSTLYRKLQEGKI